ncbi:MAG TPA: hypothetical protein VF546_24130 [Pyrinomonadaceae bacterium]|jgi:hypothetical protein
MAFNIGVNVLEVDGRAAPTIAAAPVSVAGFLVRSQRGVPHLATFVTGVADYLANFGGHMDAAFGSHAVRGFFDNGGAEAYVVRVARGDAVASNVQLNDRASPAVATLRVRAGQRGRPDPGAWGDALSVAVLDHPRGTSLVGAQILGTTSEPFALADGQTLQVTVNGAAAATLVTFHTSDFANIGAASAAEVAAAIGRQTTAYRAAVTPDRRLLLASATPGPASRLTVAGTAAATLGFGAGNNDSAGSLVSGATIAALQSTGGVLPGSAVRLETHGHVIAASAMQANLPAGAQLIVAVDGGAAQTIQFQSSDFVGGFASITPGEVIAAINRQAVGFTAALNDVNRLVLLSNSYGAGSTIAVPGGGAPDANTNLGLTAPAPVPGASVYRAVGAVSEGYKFINWTTGLPAALPANAARVVTLEFDLIVNRAGQEVERFESVTMQATLDYYVAAVVNDPDRGSAYVTVTDLASASPPGLNTPAEVRDPVTRQLVFTPLAGGSDGTTPADADFLGDQALRTGLYAFDTVAIQLLACPESTSPGVVTGALSYCEARGDAMFVGAAPRGLDLEGIKTYASAFRGRKVYGALYAPWIQIVNPADATGSNPRLWVPPVGHVLGTYARIAEERGVWKAPAGDEAVLRNVLGVEFDMTDVDHTDLVKNGSVNGIRAVPGSGVIIDSSRTLSTDTRWLFVNVRRLFNFVKSSLRTGLRFVAQEPNTNELRRMVKFNVVTPFLLGLWRQGAFGSDPADKVFTVICGPENNPPAEVNLGNFKIEVYFYPVKPAETIIIIVGQQESTAKADEA